MTTYIYRPKTLEELNVYDWRSQCSTIRVGKKKENDIESNNSENDNNSVSRTPKKSFQFLTGHPFYETHACTISNQNDKKVINFIGSPLPRFDEGDREFYCCTMLTFFKPWRSGHDLKLANQSWNDAFNSHNFLHHQLQIMKNFNIKYECLDARDDYRSQLKKGKQDACFIYDQHDNTIEHEIDDDDDDALNQDSQDSYDVSTEMPIYGTQEKKLQAEAKQIRAILTHTGWNNIKENNDNLKDFKPIIPSCNQTATQWKVIIQTIKKRKTDDITALQNKSNQPYEHVYHFLPNSVNIISKYYLQTKFYTTNEEDMINGICLFYSLNEEQERAFKIISHHAVIKDSQQLKMYIGGLGGTGKTQVIKALSCFFAERNESYRFTSVAPTGTAAALISGSTYHSKFAINDFKKDTNEKSLSNVRNQLINVDYVFLDEVSMLSCHELYRISVQLAYIFNRHDLPFGGVNMILTGDFGQLPPVIGGETVALYSRTIGKYVTHLKSQEEMIGKALWHQFTTVVILRKNMRQKDCSEDDNKLRTALMNMRYKDCTEADITFLKSKVSSQKYDSTSIWHDNFTNVSIITAKNIQKDEINKLGCEKFAKMTGQSLTHFFSEDHITTKNTEKANHKHLKKKMTNISHDLQKEIWNLPHSTADKHIPGKLSLCIGMPIMIKHNEATELCITNGQEATVVGWQSCLGSWNQHMIETLFVELTNPPNSIQLDNLPQNVVPLTRNEKTITCKLRNDTKMTITRSQVEVLPNFSMTDYASQGKTRKYNIVDLSNCRSHQAYYTALSRGATADGTIILQNFDSKKITGKASGALRQEFREVELLDEVTKLYYHDILSNDVTGTTRSSLIGCYRKNKGYAYVPKSIHPSLIWNPTDPFLEPNLEPVEWKIIKRTKTCLKNNITLKKRKTPPCKEDDEPPKKKHTGALPTQKNTPPIPKQFTWKENSCAFDAYFSILYALWYTNKMKWNDILKTINEEYLGRLVRNFEKVDKAIMTINAARDDVRLLLAEENPHLFSWGHYTSLYDLMDYTLKTPQPILQSSLICKNEHAISNNHSITVNNNYLIPISTFSHTYSVQHCMDNFEQETNHICLACNSHLKRAFEIIWPIPLIFLEFTNHTIHLHHIIQITIQNQQYQYTLRGIMYYNNNHFTSRFISTDNIIWFHDGLTTGHNMLIDGTTSNNINLTNCKGMQACCAMYEAI